MNKAMGDTVQRNSMEWTHSIPDACSVFVIGPWTALVGDPTETPPSQRAVGQYISRGFLRHKSGKSLGKDFPDSTAEGAQLQAKRWAEGSVQMWLRALSEAGAQGPMSLLPHLAPDIREKLLMAAFDSMKVAQEKGHHPAGAPIGIDALQPRIWSPQQAKEAAQQAARRKGRRRKRKRR